MFALGAWQEGQCTQGLGLTAVGSGARVLKAITLGLSAYLGSMWKMASWVVFTHTLALSLTNTKHTLMHTSIDTQRHACTHTLRVSRHEVYMAINCGIKHSRVNNVLYLSLHLPPPMLPCGLHADRPTELY